MTVDDDQLVRAVDRLVDQVGHWSPSRWTGGNGARADLVYALVQRLADIEAGVTGRPCYPVPRLGNHLALPDQVRVMTLDLVRAKPDPEILAAALDAVERARREL